MGLFIGLLGCVIIVAGAKGCSIFYLAIYSLISKDYWSVFTNITWQFFFLPVISLTLLTLWFFIYLLQSVGVEPRTCNTSVPTPKSLYQQAACLLASKLLKCFHYALNVYCFLFIFASRPSVVVHASHFTWQISRLSVLDNIHKINFRYWSNVIINLEEDLVSVFSKPL